MKIGIIGIGGVGGYFGGKIARAGFDATFIARGEHLKAIRNKGLFVKSTLGDFKASPTLATDDLSVLKDRDLIILGVKSWQVTEVAKQLRTIIKPDAIVLPWQNGADNVDKLLTQLPRENVIGGLSRIVSKIEKPGVINHFAFSPSVHYGELNNEVTDRIKAVKTVFDKAGFKNHIADDIQAEVWKKFLFITTLSGLGALTRVESGTLRSDPYLRDILLKTAREILAVAKAKEINIDEKAIEAAMNAIDNQKPETTASMQRDVMAGKPSELEDFNGYIVKEGKRLGIETPVNEFIYRCLLPMENKARER